MIILDQSLLIIYDLTTALFSDRRETPIIEALFEVYAKCLNIIYIIIVIIHD